MLDDNSKNKLYIECKEEEISHLLTNQLILLLTATSIETEELHKSMSPLAGFDGIIILHSSDLTYYIGMFGNYRVVHVQCPSMGSMSRSGSIITVTEALKMFASKCVIMVGIAFGISKKKQNIGDVLLAESIIPYNSRRVGKTETVARGIEAPSSKLLLNRFKSIIQTWEYLIDDKQKAVLIPTRLMSGEELIDNEKHRNLLINENPDSKGGEMEGAGVYAACDGKADWIVIKGICDFADGNKGKNKDKNQRVAVRAAISACLELFNSTTALNKYQKIGCEKSLTYQDIDLRNVLFDLYDESKEIYYIERDVDLIFNQKISEYGVWISGPPGIGKSNLILRNLLKSEKDFISISLASCVGGDMVSYFQVLYYEIAEKLEINNLESVSLKTLANCSSEILLLLKKYYANKNLYIFIEEIPLSTEQDSKDFASKLFSLMFSKNFIRELRDVKFVLSSINNPIAQLEPFQQKIHQQLSFLRFDYWEQKNIARLIKLISDFMPNKLNNEQLSDIEKQSKGSPRFIKKFFRTLSSLNTVDEATIEYIIKDIQRDLSL